MKEYLNLIKKYHEYMTLQEYRTLKGQILKGDFDAAQKGLSTILGRVIIQ